MAVAFLPRPVEAGSSTLLYEDFSGCALPTLWTNTAVPTGCGYSFSTTPPAPPIAAPSPAGCVAYTDASTCGSPPSTNDRLTTSTINAAGFEGLTLTVRYFLPEAVPHNLSIEVDSTVGGGTDTYDVPELDNWQTQAIDISDHAGATDLTIAFVSDDLSSGEYGTAIRSVEVEGFGATGNIVITSPGDATTHSDYPVLLEFVHTANALVPPRSSRVELFGSQLGTLRPVSDTQASFQVNYGLVEGNNLIRACLTDSYFDVACDEVTLVWVPHDGDIAPAPDGDNKVTVSDVVATVTLVLSNDYDVRVDMDGNGSLNVLDVIRLIRLITSCHPPAVNVALGAEGAYDKTSGCPAAPLPPANNALDGVHGLPWVQTCNDAIPPNHWWEVDLGRRYQIEQLVLWNTTEACCKTRLANIAVEIYDGANLVYTGPDTGLVTWTGPTADITVTIPATIGDRVRLVKTAPAPGAETDFYLGEVEIRGRPADNECTLVPQYVWALMFEEDLVKTETGSRHIVDSGSVGLDSTPGAEMFYVSGDPDRGENTHALRFENDTSNTVWLGGLALPNGRGAYLDFDADESFSVEVLFNTSGAGTMTLVSNDNGSNAGWWLRLVNGDVSFSVIDTDTTQITATSALAAEDKVNDGDWVYVLAVRDAGEDQLRIFAESTTIATAVDTTAAPVANDVDVRIGRANSGTPYQFVGDIDFVRISNFVIDPAQAPIPLPYFEPFDENPVNLGGWGSYDFGSPASNWERATLGENGTNSILTEDTASSGTVAWFGDDEWTDYEVGVWASAPEANELGVMARVTDQDNYYLFSVDGTTNLVRLSARVNGVENEIVEQAIPSSADPPPCSIDSECPASLHCIATECVPFTVGEWTYFSLEVDGVNLTGRINGEEVISGSDARLASGMVGLYTADMEFTGPGYGQHMAFDGLSVVPIGGFGIPYSDSLEKERNGVVLEDFATASEPSEWDFNSGVLRQLSEIGGNGGAAGNYGSIYVTGNTRWTSYSVSAEISAGTGDAGVPDAVGMVARFTGPGDFYLFSVSDDPSYPARLGVYEDGVWTQLQTSGFTINPSITYTMSLEVDGTNIRGEIDDPSTVGVIELPAISAINSTHRAGAVGFHTWENNQGTYDNLNIGVTNCGTNGCEPGIGETRETCPADCADCGDLFCDDPYENVINCPTDCSFCGDGTCNDDETHTNCPEDCCAVSGDCNDGDVCTDDTCNILGADRGQCQTSNNTASCDDFDDCTYSDVCAGGDCDGTPIICTDVPGACPIVRSCNGTSSCTLTYPNEDAVCDAGATDCKDDLDNTYSGRDASICNTGTCVVQSYVDCTVRYACDGPASRADGDVCVVACTVDNHCAAGYTCEATACVQLGLWTGLVSTAWGTAGNWDGDIVPDSTISAFIPAVPAGPFMPNISAARACDDLTVENGATLTFAAPIGAKLQIHGDISNEGSITSSYYADTEARYRLITTGNTGARQIGGTGTWQVDIQLGLTNAHDVLSLDDVTVGGHLDIRNDGANTALKLDNNDLTVGGNLTVSGELWAGDLVADDPTITVTGNWSSAGIFVARESTVVFNGTGQTLTTAGKHFYDVVVSGGGTTMNDNLWIGNDISVTGTLTQGSGRNIEIYGDWDSVVGTVNADTAAHTYLLGGNTTVTTGGALHFGILDINKSAGGNTVTLTGDVRSYGFNLIRGTYVIGDQTHTTEGNLNTNTINGTLQMDGAVDGVTHMDEGGFFNVGGNFTVSTPFDLVTGTIAMSNETSVQTMSIEADFTLHQESALRLARGTTVNVTSGDTFHTEGIDGNHALISRFGDNYPRPIEIFDEVVANPNAPPATILKNNRVFAVAAPSAAAQAPYAFNVLSGGRIEARFTTFEFMGIEGINVQAGALVGTAAGNDNHDFDDCKFWWGFWNGQPAGWGQAGTGFLLTLNGSETFDINNLDLAGGSYCNNDHQAHYGGNPFTLRRDPAATGNIRIMGDHDGIMWGWWHQYPMWNPNIFDWFSANSAPSPPANITIYRDYFDAQIPVSWIGPNGGDIQVRTLIGDTDGWRDIRMDGLMLVKDDTDPTVSARAEDNATLPDMPDGFQFVPVVDNFPPHWPYAFGNFGVWPNGPSDYQGTNGQFIYKLWDGPPTYYFIFWDVVPATPRWQLVSHTPTVGDPEHFPFDDAVHGGDRLCGNLPGQCRTKLTFILNGPTTIGNPLGVYSGELPFFNRSHLDLYYVHREATSYAWALNKVLSPTESVEATYGSGAGSYLERYHTGDPLEHLDWPVYWYRHWFYNMEDFEESDPALKWTLERPDDPFSATPNDAAYLNVFAEPSNSGEDAYWDNLIVEQSVDTAHVIYNISVGAAITEGAVGAWYFRATSLDRNSETSYADLSVGVDSTPPTITTFTATHTGGGNYNLTINASAGSGSPLFRWLINQSGTAPTDSEMWNALTSEPTGYVGAVPPSTLYLWIMDQAGNVQSASDAVP